MAPLACLAILPVSRIKGRPPTSTVTECGAGVLVFSDMLISFGPAFAQSVPAETSISVLAGREMRWVFCEVDELRPIRPPRLRPTYIRTRYDSTGGNTIAVGQISNRSFAETRVDPLQRAATCA